jgi:uncharacterized protein (DUF1919 family)
MSKTLEKAFEEASKLPEEKQNAIADIVIHFIHSDASDAEEEAEWDALVKSLDSQRFLEKMIKEVKEEKAQGKLLPFSGEE